MSRSSAVVSYVQGLLLPGVLTLKGYYPKGFLCARVVYIQGYVVTFIGSYLKGYFLRSGVITSCMYVCKSLFKHGKPSVKLKLKTKTNYNCFT